MPDAHGLRRRMAGLISELAPADGLHATVLNGVHLRRSSHHVPRSPVLYEPSIYIVASGRKVGYVGDRRLVYDPNNYLVLSVALPFECEADTGDGEPMLAMSVRMQVAVISELASRMSARPAQPSVAPDDELACVNATPLDAQLGDAAVRLLECLRSPVDAAILGPALTREITYRVLCGPQRETLLAMLGRNGRASQIHAVLQRMHAAYAEPLNVARLAEEAGMSVSALHHRFKAATSSSPVQYLKAVRLHKARMMMVHDGTCATEAAHRVGYESTSQFSREFKRLFGYRPSEAAKDVHRPRMFSENDSSAKTSARSTPPSEPADHPSWRG